MADGSFLPGFPFSWGLSLIDKIRAAYPEAIVDRDWDAHWERLILRVRNRSNRPIKLRHVPEKARATFSVSADLSTAAILDGVLGRPLEVVIPGGQERVLEFILPANFDERPEDERATVDIEWEYIQPIWWRWSRKLAVSPVPVRNLRALRSARGPEMIED